MSFINFGIIIISLINLLAAIIVWQRNPKNKINIFFSLAMAGVAFWGAGEGLMFISLTSQAIAFWGSVTYSFGIFVAFNFYLFTVYFPYPLYRFNKFILVFLSFCFFIALIIPIVPNFVVKGGIVGENISNNDLILNPLGFWLYSFFFLGSFIMGFYNLFYKYSRSGGFMRIQLKYTTFGALIVFIFSVIFDLLIPYFKGEIFGWVGPYATLVMIFVVAYILFFAGNDIIKIKFK
jgi:hypothetical protein